MSNQLENKNYLPHKFVTFRNNSLSRDNVGTPLQMQKTDSVNRQKVNLTAPPLKNNNYITLLHNKEPLSFGHHQEPPRHRTGHDDYLVILDSMDKRIKDLMREATGLMETILNNRKQINFDEKVQERIRLVDDRDIERQYRSLKEKVAALRRQSILDNVVSKKEGLSMATINPQSASEKPKKLQLHSVLNTKIVPQHRRESHSSKKVQPPFTSNNLPLPKDKYLHQLNDQSHLNFNHHIDHMTKRAQHYKHKSIKLQDTLEGVIRERDETDRINKQMGEEIMRLRAETLSYKYQQDNN